MQMHGAEIQKLGFEWPFKCVHLMFALELCSASNGVTSCSTCDLQIEAYLKAHQQASSVCHFTVGTFQPAAQPYLHAPESERHS